MANVLRHSPADVMAYLLVDLGLGTDPDDGGDWPVFSSGEPFSPDNCLTVTDTTGFDDGRAMVTGELFTHYGFQVRVRSSDHKIGWRKADEIRTALAQSVYDHAVHADENAYLVHCCSHIGQVIPLGKDTPTSKRSLFTLNAAVSMKELN